MRTIMVLALAALTGGCATVIRGTTNNVGFDSQPSQAEVRTSNGLGCVTPCSLVVKRNEEFVATFSKPGYRPQQVEVKTQLAAEGAMGVAGNVLLGGIIGFGVDAVTGAGGEHVPNPVSVVLEPLRPESPAARRPRPAPADPRALRPPPPPGS